MNIDNQKEYWDKVAGDKTFTHPLDISLLKNYVGLDALIVDFGCGYGRIVNELLIAGFTNVTGYDTSAELIRRGVANNLPLHHIAAPGALQIEDNSVDCILLFAVLTCIPSNKGQTNLINLLGAKLKPGGFLFISDYYLQNNELSKSRYGFYNEDKENFGVFHLPEGVVFRHHTKEWISVLLKDFLVKEEHIVPVKTMNGNTAEAFQLIAVKHV